MELPENVEFVPMTDAVLRLEPGDILVVRCQRPLSLDAQAHLRESLSGQVPDGVKLWILDAGMELQVARPNGGGREV